MYLLQVHGGSRARTIAAVQYGIVHDSIVYYLDRDHADNYETTAVQRESSSELPFIDSIVIYISHINISMKNHLYMLSYNLSKIVELIAIHNNYKSIIFYRCCIFNKLLDDPLKGIKLMQLAQMELTPFPFILLYTFESHHHHQIILHTVIPRSGFGLENLTEI